MVARLRSKGEGRGEEEEEAMREGVEVWGGGGGEGGVREVADIGGKGWWAYPGGGGWRDG